jgi:peptide/nickel transport system substrate-binding protein
MASSLVWCNAAGLIIRRSQALRQRRTFPVAQLRAELLLSAQSRELDKEKRKKIVWDIERILVEDAARPIILHSAAGNCWQPYVKNFHPHDNSQYNNLRFEDVWLDK